MVVEVGDGVSGGGRGHGVARHAGFELVDEHRARDAATMLERAAVAAEEEISMA
jgi:hypothetical protein